MFVVCYVFCNISFHPVISLPSINSTYSILKYWSLSDSCVRVCVRVHVRARVCLCTREANMNTWGAWASSGKGQPHCLLLQQKQGEKMLYFISASEIFNTSLKIVGLSCLWPKKMEQSAAHFRLQKKAWRLDVNELSGRLLPPLCPRRFSRFLRRLNYGVTLVELQELQNSEGWVLILFY